MTQALTLPPMSDEPGASLLRVLQLQAGENDNTFIGTSLPQLRSQVFGGQVLAQAMLAGMATVDTDSHPRNPNAIHATYLRPARTDAPLYFRVERVRDGRTVSSRLIDVYQHDQRIFTALLSASKGRSGPSHSAEFPRNIPSPDEVHDSIELFQQTGHPAAKFLGKTVAFSLRHINSPLYVHTPEISDRQMVWVKPRNYIPTPLKQSISQALLAYVSDQIMLEPALRSLGVSWVNPDLRIATMDHGMWFHRPIDINAWHLFVQDSPSSEDGRSFTRAQIFAQTGELVASAVQEGMIRLEHSHDDFWSMHNSPHH